MHSHATHDKKAAVTPVADVRRPRVVLAILLALFVLSTLLILPLLSHYRGDERYYTDAAIRMVKTGDWITPYYDDGLMRFRKPVLPYWLVAAGFEVFGIGVGASRIGALLAACAMLALTYRLGILATRGDRRVALFAVLMMASNLQTLNMSTRATTDTLQAACVTLAMCGLAGLQFDRRRPIHLWSFWLGVGLTGASKGGLAALIVAFAIAWGFARGKRTGMRLRDWLHMPPMLVGLALAGGWFVAVLIQHGHTAWAEFWNDQVGNRLNGVGVRDWLGHLGEYLIAMPRDYFPWSVLLFFAGVGQLPRVRALLKQHADLCGLAIAWYVVLLLIFTIGNTGRSRYFLPAYPLVSVAGARLLLSLWTAPTAERRVLFIMRLAFAAFVGVGGAMAALGWRIDRVVSIGGAVMLAMALIAIALLALLQKSRPIDDGRLWHNAIALSVLILLSDRANELFARRALSSPSGPTVMNPVGDRLYDAEHVAAVNVPPGLRAQIRLLSGGRIEVDPFPADAPADALADYDAILYGNATTMPTSLPPGFDTAPAGRVFIGWRFDEAVKVCLGRKSKESVIESRSTPTLLAYRAGGARHRIGTFATTRPSADGEADED